MVTRIVAHIGPSLPEPRSVRGPATARCDCPDAPACARRHRRHCELSIALVAARTGRVGGGARLAARAHGGHRAADGRAGGAADGARQSRCASVRADRLVLAGGTGVHDVFPRMAARSGVLPPASQRHVPAARHQPAHGALLGRRQGVRRAAQGAEAGDGRASRRGADRDVDQDSVDAPSSAAGDRFKDRTGSSRRGASTGCCARSPR